MGRDEYNRRVFDQSKGFTFSNYNNYTAEQIQSAVDLLETSHSIPPPMCLVFLLESHMPIHYLNMLCNGQGENYSKDVPLRLRSAQMKIIETVNKFIYAGGKEWLRQDNERN